MKMTNIAKLRTRTALKLGRETIVHLSLAALEGAKGANGPLSNAFSCTDTNCGPPK